MLSLRIPVKRFNIGDIVRVINSKSHHNGRIGVITQSNYSIKWLNKEAEDKVDRSNFMSCNLKLVEDDFEPGEYPIIADNLELVNSKTWIPVTERLPEEAGVYLVSMNHLGYPQRDIDGFVHGKWERYGSAVIAWCKIPEPYEEDEG